MKVRVLGCSGAIARDCRTTSFLIDDHILLDAGTGVGDLSLDEMKAIDHVLLTHSHLDHIAALPLMLDSVSGLRSRPVEVHALPQTIHALKQHIFNNVIWPDFSVIPSREAPFLRFFPIATGEILTIEGIAIEVLPAVHTVSAVGYALRGDSGWWVFSGDTERNPAFWTRVNALPVAMLVIETAFSNRERDLAHRSLHLCPDSLLEELALFKQAPACPIYITHTKPSETGSIVGEIKRCGSDFNGRIEWLCAGQQFDI